MSEEKYKECKNVTSVGQAAVYVTPQYPHAHMICGTPVVTKSQCARCTKKKPGRKKIKYDKEQLKKYVEQNKSDEEIAKLMDTSISTVAIWVKESGLSGIRKQGGRGVREHE